MATYVLLSHMQTSVTDDPAEFRKIAARVTETIRKECPEVTWKDSYALFGRFDVLDVFEAPGERDAQRVATIIRRLGKSNTETMQAIPWQEFLNNL